ncbi:DUF7661 family protein [Ferrimonas marina]|uniref:DUF7661 domain-containing protein n=1 Tax=Ferrimonas marina TaxID=299255 RepID=A0A1M5MTP5_9GAMM|nr:hypothetical protein [Ferrimonas marina]SHG80567.1 hypothetical protein SAMN02745129_0772 [Ferrimonas marina]
MYLLFDVFGRRMSVKRVGEEWQLFRDSESGLRARVYDVVIPADLAQTQLSRYLADLYHEWASERHPGVTWLNPPSDGED